MKKYAPCAAGLPSSLLVAGVFAAAPVNAQVGGCNNAGTWNQSRGTLTCTPFLNNVTGLLRFFDGASAGTVSLTNLGTVQFHDTSTGGNATVTNSAGIFFLDMSTAGNARLIANAGGTVDFSGTIGPLGNRKVSAGSIEGAGTFSLGANQLTVGANNLSTKVSGTIRDGGTSGGSGGSLVKVGSGTLVLTGNNTYTGGTTIGAGTLQIGNGGSSGSIVGAVANYGALVFNRSDTVAFAGAISGTGSVTKLGSGTLILTGANSYAGGTTVSAGTLQGDSASLHGNIVNNAAVVFDQAVTGTYGGAISGTGSLTKQGAGVLTLTGAHTFTGLTTVNAGTLAVNGSVPGGVTVNTGGTLAGSGTVGSVTVMGGTLAPGNSFGTLTVSGNYQQNGGTYLVDVNCFCQSDRINVGGTATINGGTVQVMAQPGTFARNTTYTILNATGGVSGAYAAVNSNFAFLTPSLSYDANNVYLLMAQNQSAFEGGGQTGNERAVGRALDRANSTATGDFNTVLNVLSGLSTQQGPAALEQLSGQAYGGFAITGARTSQLFMNQLGREMAAARGTAEGNRVALAKACEAECEDALPTRWGAWLNAAGALGSVLGDGNTHTTTYSISGTAAGIDFLVDPRLLVGVGVGYSKASMWLDGPSGSGSTDGLQVALYGSFSAPAIYVDALAGYAYSSGSLQRPIFIPGLASRTASGSPQANQFFGQVESGYRINVDGGSATTVTPFARLQGWTSLQGAFSESGAGSISLNVAQQNTTSVRSIFGAEIAAATQTGWLGEFALQLRLGWAHEYSDVAYPVTASFAGAPFAGFTVLGVTLPRDSAILGLAVRTRIADSASLYLRYDGEVSGANNAHALTLGARISW